MTTARDVNVVAASFLPPFVQTVGTALDVADWIRNWSTRIKPSFESRMKPKEQKTP